MNRKVQHFHTVGLVNLFLKGSALKLFNPPVYPVFGGSWLFWLIVTQPPLGRGIG